MAGRRGDPKLVQPQPSGSVPADAATAPATGPEPNPRSATTEDITASVVPDSAFHGQRTRFAHPGRVDNSIARTLSSLSETAGVAEITRTTDGTHEVRTLGGATFRIRAVAGPTGSDVARSTLDRSTGLVEIRISDRAIAPAVPRALAHEIAEAAAFFDGHTQRSDVLTAQAPVSDQPLDVGVISPHDRGRIAELRYLSDQLESALPMGRWRASNEAAALLRHLGLIAGRHDPATGQFDGRSPGFQHRMAALPVPVQVLVTQLNALPQVGSLPTQVAEQWRYVAKGLLTRGTVGVVAAGVLAVAATAAATPALLTVAGVTGSAALAHAVISSLAERRHDVRSEYLSAVVDARIPLEADSRQLLDMEAADLAAQAEGARRLAEDGAAQLRGGPARPELIRQAGEHQHRAGPVSRFTHPPEGEPTVPSRRTGTASADAVRAEAAKAAEPTADERTKEIDKVPGLGSWVLRTTLGPGAGLGVGVLAHAILVSSLALPAMPTVLAGLVVVTAAAGVNAIGQRFFAQRQASAKGEHYAVRDARAQARAQVRIDSATRTQHAHQAELEARAARRRAHLTELSRAERALIAHAAVPDPDAGLPRESLPPSADLASPSRGSDLADRNATMDVSAIADSSFEADGRRFAHAERVERQGRSALAQLGPRDGVRSATVDAGGTVELHYDGRSEPVRVSVVAVAAATLIQRSVVAQIRPHGDGSYTLEISDRAAGPTVARAALTALDQILAVHSGSPTGANQLVPGAAHGPIDPATLTAADRARVADLTRLLDALDAARRWSRRSLAGEYQAALRAAGLDLPISTDSDPDGHGSPRRRGVLDPQLLARVEARDPLPSTTPSVWAHQRKWFGAIAVPAVAAPALLAGMNGLDDPSILRMITAAVSPVVVGALTAMAEWQLNRSVEARQRKLDVGKTIPSSPTLQRENAYRDAVAARALTERRQAGAAEESLTARQRRFEAALARAERSAVLRSAPLPARILDALNRRADPAPSPVAAPMAPETAPTGAPARPSSAQADRAATQAVLTAVATEEPSAADPAKAAVPSRAKPRLIDYAGLVIVPAVAAAGVAIGVASVIGGIPLSQIFDPTMWQAMGEPYLGLLGVSVISAVAAAVSPLGVLGERLVGNRNPELKAGRRAAQKAHREQLVPPVRQARLAPLRLDLGNARSELAAVQTAQAHAEARQASQLVQAVPIRGAGPLRALTDLFGGPDRATNGPLTPLPGHPRMEAAIAAVERAARAVGRGIQHHGRGLLSITRPDGSSLPAQLSVDDVAGSAPVTVSEQNGSLRITIDRNSGVAESERQIAHDVTAFITAESGVPQGEPTLSRSPLPTDSTPDTLTADDHARLAELAELLRQVRAASPISRAVLEQRLTALVDLAGLRLGAPDAGARHALLPSSVASELARHHDSRPAHDESVVGQAVSTGLAVIGAATGLELSQDGADPAVLQVRTPEGVVRAVRIQVGTPAAGIVADLATAPGRDIVTIDGRSSRTATQIALAGALAELVARMQNAPSGPRLLRPGSTSAAATREGLTVADRRALAELRVAARLAESSAGDAAAQRWHDALAKELGLHGAGTGPAARRGVLAPAEERALAARQRGELEELVLARQFVEVAANRAEATSVRVRADRILVSRDGRRVEVDLIVVTALPDGQPVARVDVLGDARLGVVLSHGAEVSPMAPTISRLVEAALSDDGDLASLPNPVDTATEQVRDRGVTDPNNSGLPRTATEQAYFEQMRRTVNTTGWDDLEECCTSSPELPCVCGLPKIGTDPKPPTQNPPNPDPPDRPRPDDGSNPDDCPPEAVLVLPPVPQQGPLPTPSHAPPLVPSPAPPPVASPAPPAGTAPPNPLPPDPDPDHRGCGQPITGWLDLIDPWGNRHVIALVEWPCPGGGRIRLLVWLIVPPAPAAPVIVLCELVGTAVPLALRQYIADVAGGVFALITEQVPTIESSLPRWLVHHGAFSTPDRSLPETFHEVALTRDEEHWRLNGVRLLDPAETAEMAAALHLRPVDEVVDGMNSQCDAGNR